MTNHAALDFGAFVVGAFFVGENAMFALGDGSVRIVGAGEHRLAVHGGGILSAALSRDGKSLVTGGDDGVVSRVDDTGAVEQIAAMPGKWIDRIAAGPDGAVAFSAGRHVRVRFGDGRKKHLDLPRAAGGIAFAPKGMRLAIATYDGILLWWPATEAPPARLEWKGAHLDATFSPDGRFAVSSMQENALHGWRLDDGKDMRMSGYPAKTRSMAWTAKGRYLATSGANAAILWPFQGKDGPMGKEPLQIGAREPLVTCVACDPRQERVAIGYQDGMVVLAGLGDAPTTVLHPPARAAVSALAFDRGGTSVVFGAEDGIGGVVHLAT